MRNTFLRTLGTLAVAALLLPAVSSCVGDLDQAPDYSANSEVVFRDPAQIEQALGRLYATLAVSGQDGPAGRADISGIDEGFSNYLRQYWSLQEITTDEAALGWNDGNLPLVNRLQWDADNEFVRALYDRIYYQIALCNEFVRQTSDARLSERGISGDAATRVRTFRAEARFLRALSYYHAMDMFGGGVFADETSNIGDRPQIRTRQQYFEYVEKELSEIEPLLQAPRAVYGRADQGALWALQTKLYLNAQEYTGTARWADAITAARKVLATSSGYSLSPRYGDLFRADNDRSAARNEIIFPITSDGLRTQSYGSMTFIMRAQITRALNVTARDSFGVKDGWNGLRTKPDLVDLFRVNGTLTSDRRAMFFFDKQNPQSDTLGQPSSGPLVTKYRNITSTGQGGSDSPQRGGSGNFPDTDFPLFRLADVKLMLAEALLRSGGSTSEALQQVNDLRTRARATQLGSITIDGILAERGRELYWEGHRRTDLIRFGRYTAGGSRTTPGGPEAFWPFKNSTTSVGRSVAATRKLFPIPNTARVANSEIPQNDGY